ncbi:MAG: hypothetical protein ACREM3_10465 [Candidatus Rokuibacteriota bacterium]
MSKAAFFQTRGYREPWRLAFVVGLPLGGLVAAVLGGAFAPGLAYGQLDALTGGSVAAKAGSPRWARGSWWRSSRWRGSWSARTSTARSARAPARRRQGRLAPRPRPDPRPEGARVPGGERAANAALARAGDFASPVVLNWAAVGLLQER